MKHGPVMHFTEWESRNRQLSSTASSRDQPNSEQKLKTLLITELKQNYKLKAAVYAQENITHF